MTFLAENIDEHYAVFMCEHGTVHLVMGHFKICMPADEFYELADATHAASRRIQLGDWKLPCAMIRYRNATVEVPVEGVAPLSDTLQEAAAAIRRADPCPELRGPVEPDPPTADPAPGGSGTRISDN